MVSQKLLFIIVVSLLSTMSFIYCFVFVDIKGKGKRAMIKRFLYQTLPDFCKSFVRKICGDKGISAIERIQSWMCFEANPLIQIFYAVLAVGGYYIYVVHGYA